MSSDPLAKRSQMAPVGRGVRAYAAPVHRDSGVLVPFDPAVAGMFDLNSPPDPWLDLGWVENFQRTSPTQYQALRTGPGGNITLQYRTQPETRIEFDFPSWGKLQMALSGGSQQMNVLAVTLTASPTGSGGMALPAVYVQAFSTPMELYLPQASLSGFHPGDIVAVDWDYGGAAGYVGTGVPAAYLPSALDAPSHVDFIRRVTFNVSRVSTLTSTSLRLTQPLLERPATGMGVQRVVAFVDREGDTFFQEWSLVFAIDGDSGGRVCLYYPRVQAAESARETHREFPAPLINTMLHASLRALPSADPNDGQTVLCYRSYFPASAAAVY